MNLLSGLAAVSRGVQLGLEDGRAEEDRQRRIKREEADMAWQDEARGRQRSQWTQADEEQERQKRIKSGLAEAYKPYTPEEIDLGVGDGGEPNTKGYRIDGQLFQSMDDPKAKQALTELNSPLGQAKRLAQVYMKEGDYPGAQKVLADAMRTSVDQFNLDRLAREADHLKANDALFASLNGEAGSNKFENGARVATLTQQFGLNGKEVKAEFTADGKRVVMGIYGKGEDGNPIREGALATYTNDRQGLLDMYADFHKGSPEQKIALWKEALARDRQAQEDGRKAEEHTAKIGLQGAQAAYYGKLGEAATTRASGANAGAGSRRDEIADEKRWTAAMKPEKDVVSITSEDGKTIASSTLNAAYKQTILDAKAKGLDPDEAVAEAAATMEGLKDLAERRMTAARKADRKSTMTFDQALRATIAELSPRAAQQQPSRQQGAPAAQPQNVARAAPSASPGLQPRQQDPMEMMNIGTLRRIAAIPGHVNQRAAQERLRAIEAESAAQAERQMQENPAGFGLVPQ